MLLRPSHAGKGRRPSRIAVVGSINQDLVLDMPHIPAPGETVLASHVMRSAGGKGANQAVACARDGGYVVMLGAVGNDDDGRDLRGKLEAENIDTGLIRAVNLQTGLAIVNIGADAENSIVVVPGANHALTSLSMAERSAIRSADVLLLQLEIPMETVVEAASVATGLVILNAAPATVLPNNLVTQIDILLMNESEAAAVGSQADSVPAVITTTGPRGAVVRQQGRRAQVVDGRPATAVDTTAAGDTFAGVLAAQIARGTRLLDAVIRANAAAALTVQRRGAQSSIPYAHETDTALETFKKVPRGSVC